MELDGRHSKVLIKLANTVVRPLLLLKGCDGRRSLDNWKIQILYPSSRRVRGGSGELKDGPPNFSLWDGYRTNQNKKITLQNWRELLIYWSTTLSFIGILTNWRSTLEESSWISRKKCEVWHLGRNTPMQQNWFGDWLAGSRLAEKKLRAWWTSGMGISSVSLQQIR